MKIIKKLDIVIIVFLVLLSFTPNLLFASELKSQNYNSTYATISLDGKLYDTIPLSSFKGKKTIEIKDDHGHSNTILIKDNTIQIIDTNCSDKICIDQGPISKTRQTIVCLPHKLIIEVKGEVNDSSDDMILSQ